MSFRERDKKDLTQKNRVAVNIFNREYIIRSEEDGRHIEAVAAYVDAKMRQLTLKCPDLNPVKVAVLTSLNTANDLFNLKKDYEALLGMLDEDKNENNK